MSHGFFAHCQRLLHDDLMSSARERQGKTTAFASSTRESIMNAAGVMQVRPITNTTTTIRLHAITDRQQLRVLQCTSASCICMFRMIRIWSGHFAAQRHMASKAMLHVHVKGRGYLPVSSSAWWLRPVKALIFIP